MTVAELIEWLQTQPKDRSFYLGDNLARMTVEELIDYLEDQWRQDRDLSELELCYCGEDQGGGYSYDSEWESCF